MDRMVQTALSSITGLKDLKFDLANNLANANVPGFRRDLPNEGSAGFLSSLSPPAEGLTKSLDGKIRNFDGSIPDADQSGLFAQGVLEGSNVNAIEEMVFNMDMQRQFEINVKLIKQAEEIDKSGTKLMSLPT